MSGERNVMNIRLQIILILGILAFAGLLMHCLIKKKLHLKYCLVWIAAIIVMLISAVFPNLIKWITKLAGIKTPSNFIFVLYGLFILLIVFALTAIVSHMNMRIFRLVQYQAILEERLRKVESFQKQEQVTFDFSTAREEHNE